MFHRKLLCAWMAVGLLAFMETHTFGQQAVDLLAKADVAVSRADYSLAETLYLEILKIDKTNTKAKLGLAVAGIKSRDSAKKVVSIDSDSFSFAKRPARGFFDSKADSASYKEQSSDSYKPRFDFTLLGGYTSSKLAGFPNRANEANIRFIEFAVEPTRHSRVWIQYDNGLSLDSFALARANRNVPTYTVGGLVNYKKYYLTKFAFGWRNLPGGIGQKLYDIEQVFFLPKNYSLDAGILIAPRDDNRTETVFHSGFGIPLGEKLRVHPNVFYAQSGLPGEKQIRGLFQAEYTFANGVKLHPGYAFGREFRRSPLSDNNVNDVFFKFSFPVKKYLRPQFMIRHESIGASSATILSFGFTISNKEL